MAYELHLQRQSSPLTIAEWRAAVSQLDSVRLANGDGSVVNPSTGERIALAHQEGNAEIRLASGEWVPCFRFARGQISFKATADIGSESDPTHIAASELAAILEAEIVGDEGETYRW